MLVVLEGKSDFGAGGELGTTVGWPLSPRLSGAFCVFGICVPLQLNLSHSEGGCRAAAGGQALIRPEGINWEGGRNRHA
jgi:hypothetical protein